MRARALTATLSFASMASDLSPDTQLKCLFGEFRGVKCCPEASTLRGSTGTSAALNLCFDDFKVGDNISHRPGLEALCS